MSVIELSWTAKIRSGIHFPKSAQSNQDKLISLRPIGRGSGSNVDVDDDFVVVVVVVGIDVDDVDLVGIDVDFILSLMLFTILL